MTAQITDQYTYKGEEYSIIAMTESIEFDPEQYGFHPEAPHTACWRGYWCEFLITDEALLLDTLHIYSGDHDYPEFNGVQPQASKEEWDDMATYYGLNFPIDYSGSIVLGSGFLERYYIHMGFQRAWAYENVIELVFKHGRVTDRKDHGETVAKIREEIDRDPEGFRDRMHADIPRFVDNSFSLDTSIKAWWI